MLRLLNAFPIWLLAVFVTLVVVFDPVAVGAENPALFYFRHYGLETVSIRGHRAYVQLLVSNVMEIQGSWMALLTQLAFFFRLVFQELILDDTFPFFYFREPFDFVVGVPFLVVFFLVFSSFRFVFVGHRTSP